MNRFDLSVKLCIGLALAFTILAFFVWQAVFGIVIFVIAGFLLLFNAS